MIKINSVTLKENSVSCGIIVSIPHSSYNITTEMKENIKPDVIFANNDWYLNELYKFLNELGIVTVSANYSRYVIDVNRKIEYKYDHKEYTKSLIYFNTTFNKEIYVKPPCKSIIEYRIENIYNPYHLCLIREINKVLKEKNTVYLFDLHSFYSQSEADIVLGTRYGETCSKQFLNIVYNAFINEGFTVKIDEVGLRGGYITYHYGSIKDVQAIQIEIRYTTYIENRYFGEEFMPKINYKLFYKTQSRLNRVFKVIKQSIYFV